MAHDYEEIKKFKKMKDKTLGVENFRMMPKALFHYCRLWWLGRIVRRMPIVEIIQLPIRPWAKGEHFYWMGSSSEKLR